MCCLNFKGKSECGGKRLVPLQSAIFNQTHGNDKEMMIEHMVRFKISVVLKL